jgi:pilus assembly protein CpaE
MADTEKINVVIVDDIAETRENIRKLLQFEPNIDVVGVARSGAEAIKVSAETNPDVVLMDINMPDMDGITATERIRARLPGVQIVILSVQSDPNYMRQAMLAGARDFLTKPPDLDELLSAIRRAGEMAHQEKQKAANTLAAVQASGMGTAGGTFFPARFDGKVISVYSPKGGVGCTTITANLAVALHSEETPVVVIDSRVQFGDLTFFFNEQTKTDLGDVATRADELDPDFIEEVLLTHSTSGVRILAAPPRPERADPVNATQFAMIVQFLKRMFAWVVIDTNSGLDEVTQAALDESDLLALVTTQDIPSVKNVRLFLDMLTAYGYPVERVFIVMNMFDKRRTTASPERIADITKTEVAAVLPFDDRLVTPAMDRGVPFLPENKTHPISKGIFAMIRRMKAKIVEFEEAEIEAREI